MPSSQAPVRLVTDTRFQLLFLINRDFCSGELKPVVHVLEFQALGPWTVFFRQGIDQAVKDFFVCFLVSPSFVGGDCMSSRLCCVELENGRVYRQQDPVEHS